jgi:hypothetical protein
VRLAWTDYGVADGPVPDVDDRHLWAEVNPALGGRLNIAEVERERALMGEAEFARERLGWWGDPQAAASGAFPPGRWLACRVGGERRPAPVAVAVAVSVDRVWSSIGAASGGERPHLGSVAREQGTAWVAAEVKRIQDEHHCVVVVDGGGPAGALVPELEAAGVAVTVAKMGDYLEACARLYDMVDRAGVTHGDYTDLNAAVGAAQKRDVGDRWAWARRSGDISALEAVTLALWGASSPDTDVWGFWQ